jgi:hypothetical protein
VIEGLELIETVTPSYKHARRRGMTDEEAETAVTWAVEQAIILLEKLLELEQLLEQLIGATDE